MSQPNLEVRQIFEAQLKHRNIQFEVLNDGRYKIYRESKEWTISIDNLTRQYERDREISSVDRFLDTIMSVDKNPPNWEAARENLFQVLEGVDLEISDDVIQKNPSERVNLVAVCYEEEKGYLTFVTKTDVKDWGVSISDIWDTSQNNLEALMADTKITYLDADGLTLGVINAEQPFKASLIITSSLREKVEGRLGWPIFAVAPSRGFVYLLSKSDKDQLGRLSGVILTEFRSAEYPISTEIWEVSDTGIKSIGLFPVE